MNADAYLQCYKRLYWVHLQCWGKLHERHLQHHNYINGDNNHNSDSSKPPEPWWANIHCTCPFKTVDSFLCHNANHDKADG